LKKQEDIGNEIEKSLHEYILQEANEKGFREPLKSDWIAYMLDRKRVRQVVKSILFHFDITLEERHRVLDVGCGFGGLLLVLQNYFDEVFGIDINKEYVKWAKKRAVRSKVICGNAIKLPWPDRYFDLVICTDVFEHISYEEQEFALSELMRVLKPGGHGFLTVPNKLQIFDEHNYAFFATWLPELIRKHYVKYLLKNNYCCCWERTGGGWKKLCETKGFQVYMKPIIPTKEKVSKRFLFPNFLWQIVTFLPPTRYEIFLTKVN